MRLFKYKCIGGMCLFSWGDWSDAKKCKHCGLTYSEIETAWDKLESVYHTAVPYHLRPKNIWYVFKCWAWKRYTTIKPRKLDHGWCDRSHLMPHAIFEIACQFIEEEGPKSEEDWLWEKEHNPEWHNALVETRQLCDWWLNEYNEGYPHDLPSSELAALEEETRKNCFDLEEDYRMSVIEKCKRLVELSPYFWS